MLVVTTTMRMVDRIHSNTTSLGPAVPLDLELVHSARGLEERLIGSSATSNNANHATGSRRNDLLGTRGELDTGPALVGIVTNDGNVIARSPAKRTAVSSLLLDVGNNGTFGHRPEGKDVANVYGGLLSSIDELPSVHALVGNKSLMSELVAVRVTENDLGKWCPSARIVDDVLHDTADISMALTVVEGSELGGVLSQSGVGSEDRPSTLPLIADDSSHCEL